MKKLPILNISLILLVVALFASCDLKNSNHCKCLLFQSSSRQSTYVVDISNNHITIDIGLMNKEIRHKILNKESISEEDCLLEKNIEHKEKKLDEKSAQEFLTIYKNLSLKKNVNEFTQMWGNDMWCVLIFIGEKKFFIDAENIHKYDLEQLFNFIESQSNVKLFETKYAEEEAI